MLLSISYHNFRKTIRVAGVFTYALLYSHLSFSFDTEDGRNTKANFKDSKDYANYHAAYDSVLAIWESPLKEFDIQTTLGTAHILIWGNDTAPALLLLHGLNASSTMWYPNSKNLGTHYKIYAIDYLMEPGKSKPTENITDIKLIIKWYEEILDSLNIDRVSIVGASRGGWLAVSLAIESKRIDKIALLSPAQTFSTTKVRKSFLPTFSFFLKPKREKLDKVLNVLSHDPSKINPIWVNQFYIANKYGTKNSGLHKMQKFEETELKKIKIPVLLLVGDNDVFNDKESLKRANDFVPNITTKTINEAGHFLSFDQPDIVDRHIIDFLNGSNVK